MAISLQAVNLATPTNNGAWQKVHWQNLLPNSSFPDNSNIALYNINLNRDISLDISVDIDGLEVTENDLSFSILKTGNLSVENSINVNNYNFSINLLEGGRLSCRDFEGFNAYEGRGFNINFLGGEFVCEANKGWLKNSTRITWNFGGFYKNKFYPAKEKSINVDCPIGFGFMSRGKHFVNFNLSKENAIALKNDLSPQRAIIFCNDKANISTFGYNLNRINYGDLKSGRYYFALISTKSDINIESVKYTFKEIPPFLEFRGIHKKQVSDASGTSRFLIYLEIEVL